MYACAAVTENGVRCRRDALLPADKDCFCGQHAGMRDAGQVVERAGPADTVLYKFNLNDRWKTRMMELGVPEKERDVRTEEARHVAHANAHGRAAYAIRKDVADSGVPVFGKQGLCKVSLYEVFLELAAAYEVVDIHIKPRRDKANKWMSVLVVSFSHGEKAAQNTSAFQELMSFLASSCWGYVHVWVNPPQKDGRVIHTVNSSHREEKSQPELTLRLEGGLWSSNPAPVQPA